MRAAAAGIYTHTPEQLEEAGKYLEEKRAALKGVKIVTELEPINMYYKAEVGAAYGLGCGLGYFVASLVHLCFGLLCFIARCPSLVSLRAQVDLLWNGRTFV